jgi:tyrosyl-tRNA synthetase
MPWLEKYGQEYDKIILKYDEFSGHLMARNQRHLQQNGIEVVTVPGGCTSFLQELDVGINKPFKDYTRQAITHKISKDTEKKTTTLKQVGEIIMNGWGSVHKLSIRNSFHACMGEHFTR